MLLPLLLHQFALLNLNICQVRLRFKVSLPEKDTIKLLRKVVVAAYLSGKDYKTISWQFVHHSTEKKKYSQVENSK